jgi:hypothetical protein
MGLSDFQAAACHLIDSMARPLRAADSAHATGILPALDENKWLAISAALRFPSFQHHCPIALSLNTPESLLQLCGWLLQQCWFHDS